MKQMERVTYWYADGVAYTVRQEWSKDMGEAMDKAAAKLREHGIDPYHSTPYVDWTDETEEESADMYVLLDSLRKGE